MNAVNVLRGHLDLDLDDVGRAEAEALAQELACWRPIRIVASPLRRAMQTAAAIGRLAGLPVIPEPGLIDRDYDQWAGRPAEEVIARFGSLSGASRVERLDHLRYRAALTLDQQLPYLGTRPVVLVAHDVVNRELLALLDAELGSADWIGQRTACWNELVHDMGDWRVLQVNRKPAAALGVAS